MSQQAGEPGGEAEGTRTPSARPDGTQDATDAQRNGRGDTAAKGNGHEGAGDGAELSPDDPRVKKIIEQTVAGLRRNRDEVMDRFQKQKTQLEELQLKLEGIDLDKVRELHEAAEAAQFEDLKKHGNVGEMVAQINEKHARDKAKVTEGYEKKLQAKDQVIERVVTDRDIASAVSAVNVLSYYRKSVESLFRSVSRLKVDAEGIPQLVVETDGGDVPLGDWAKAWAESDEGQAHIQARVDFGGGADTRAGGKNEVNPWRAETRNVTDQHRMIRDNPERARRLAQQAGVRLPA